MQDFVAELQLVLFLDCGISLDSPSGKPETLIAFEFTNVKQEMIECSVYCLQIC